MKYLALTLVGASVLWLSALSLAEEHEQEVPASHSVIVLTNIAQRGVDQVSSLLAPIAKQDFAPQYTERRDRVLAEVRRYMDAAAYTERIAPILEDTFSTSEWKELKRLLSSPLARRWFGALRERAAQLDQADAEWASAVVQEFYSRFAAVR